MVDVMVSLHVLAIIVRGRRCPDMGAVSARGTRGEGAAEALPGTTLRLVRDDARVGGRALESARAEGVPTTDARLQGERACEGMSVDIHTV